MKALFYTYLLGLTAMLFAVSCTDEVEGPRYKPRHDITDLLIEDLQAGNDISLDSGIYYVSKSIKVEGYAGTISGAGKGKTIIRPMEEFKVTNFHEDLNAPEIEVAMIFSIYYPVGDITLRDITFRIVGIAPAESHENQYGKRRTVIDYVFVVAGAQHTPLTVSVKNIEVLAEETYYPHTYGKNLVAAIAVGCLPIDSAKNQPINLIVENSTMLNVGIADIIHFRPAGGYCTIKNNQFTNSNDVIFLTNYMTEIPVRIEGNTFNNILEDIVDNDDGAKCCFLGNTLDGQPLPDDCQ